MTLPTLHLGGTHADILCEDYSKAHEAIYAAIKAFDAIEFNQRDYLQKCQWKEAFDKRHKIRKGLIEALIYTEIHVELTNANRLN